MCLWARLSYAHRPIQSLLPPTISFLELLRPGPIIPCPNSRTRYQTTRDYHYVPSPLKLFKLGHAKPVDSAFPISSHGNHTSFLPIVCPPSASWLTLGPSPCGPVWCAVSPVSRDLWLYSFSFVTLISVSVAYYSSFKEIPGTLKAPWLSWADVPI